MLMFRSTHRKLVDVLMEAERDRAGMYRDVIAKLKEENEQLRERLRVATGGAVRPADRPRLVGERADGYVPLRDKLTPPGRAREPVAQPSTAAREPTVTIVATSPIEIITRGVIGHREAAPHSQDDRPAERSAEKGSGKEAEKSAPEPAIRGDEFVTGGSFGGESYSSGGSISSSSSSSSDSGSSSGGSSDGGGGGSD